jgi:hypothetical protein
VRRVHAIDVEGRIAFGIAQALRLGQGFGKTQPCSRMALRMKLLVPLMMPASHSMRLAPRPSRKALMMGMLTATAPSKATLTPAAEAAAKISLPCWASKALLAVTTGLPRPGPAAASAAAVRCRHGLDHHVDLGVGDQGLGVGHQAHLRAQPGGRAPEVARRGHADRIGRPARSAISCWLRCSTLQRAGPGAQADQAHAQHRAGGRGGDRGEGSFRIVVHACSSPDQNEKTQLPGWVGSNTHQGQPVRPPQRC